MNLYGTLITSSRGHSNLSVKERNLGVDVYCPNEILKDFATEVITKALHQVEEFDEHLKVADKIGIGPTEAASAYYNGVIFLGLDEYREVFKGD